MGGERKRPRQHLLLFSAACLTLLMMAACSLPADRGRPPGKEADLNEASGRASTSPPGRLERRVVTQERRIRELNQTIRHLRQSNRELRQQLEDLKAVDLEQEPADQIGEVP